MKIVKIILPVLGAILIALAVKSFIAIPGSTAVFEEAVYLEEPVVLPENEGKFIVIHGDAEMTRPAYDEELGLTIQTVKAYRYDEKYKEVSVKDGVHTWDWQGIGQQTIVGAAVIGGFELDEKILGAFPIDTDKYYDEFDAKELQPYELGYALSDTNNAVSYTDQLCLIRNGKYYYPVHTYSVGDQQIIRDIDRDIIDERDGAHAYSYRYYDDAQHGELTVAGIQRGNTLTAHEKIGPVVHDGIKSLDELASANKNAAIGGSVAFFVIGIGLVFLGIRKWKKQ